MPTASPPGARPAGRCRSGPAPAQPPWRPSAATATTTDAPSSPRPPPSALPDQPLTASVMESGLAFRAVDRQLALEERDGAPDRTSRLDSALGAGVDHRRTPAMLGCNLACSRQAGTRP